MSIFYELSWLWKACGIALAAAAACVGCAWVAYRAAGRRFSGKAAAVAAAIGLAIGIGIVFAIAGTPMPI